MKCVVLCCTVPYNIEACCTVLYLLFCSILKRVVLYCIVINCTVAYSILPRFVLCLLKVEMLGKGGGRVNLSGNLQEVRTSVMSILGSIIDLHLIQIYGLINFLFESYDVHTLQRLL